MAWNNASNLSNLITEFAHLVRESTPKATMRQAATMHVRYIPAMRLILYVGGGSKLGFAACEVPGQKLAPQTFIVSSVSKRLLFCTTSSVRFDSDVPFDSGEDDVSPDPLDSTGIYTTLYNGI